MPTTPLLGITQVSTNQYGKETTINDAILALENATNATLSVSYAAVSTYTLSGTQASRNMIFKATEATGACELKFPITINGNPTNRIFVGINASGYAMTVKFASGAGSTVVIPNGEARLIVASGGLDMKVAAEAPSVVNFLSLADVPGSYTGEGGRFLAVNLAENALEFVDAAVFPALAGKAGHYLVVKNTEDGVEWSPAAPVAAFLDLTDTPASYTGNANKIAAVKATEDGLEFIDPPSAEAVEFPASDQWRIRILTPGSETQVGFGEIELQNASRVDQVGTGTAAANTYVTGKEPTYAFDNALSAGAGWLSDSAFVGVPQISYTFSSPLSIRYVKIWPISGAPTYSPLRFVVERYNGGTWVEAGDFTVSGWTDGVPQSFTLLGQPLSSVAEAASDGVPYVRRDAGWEDAREWIRDVMGSAMVAGTGVTVTVNDAGDTITIASSVTAYTDEMARDALGAALVAGSGITITVNDAGDTITLAATGGGSLPPLTGKAGKFLKVNAAETDTEWGVPASGAGGTRPTVVQYASSSSNTGSVTMGAAPTAGNILICVASHYTNVTTVTSGWTILLNRNGASTDGNIILTKVVDADDGTTLSPFGDRAGCNMTIFEIADSMGVIVLPWKDIQEKTGLTTTTLKMGIPRDNCLLVGAFATVSANTAPTGITGATAGTTVTGTSTSASPRQITPFTNNTVTKGNQTVTATYAASPRSYAWGVVCLPS